MNGCCWNSPQQVSFLETLLGFGTGGGVRRDKKQDNPDDDIVPALTEIIAEIFINHPDSRVYGSEIFHHIAKYIKTGICGNGRIDGLALEYAGGRHQLRVFRRSCMSNQVTRDEITLTLSTSSSARSHFV